VITHPLRAEAMGKPFVSGHAIQRAFVVCFYPQVATERLHDAGNVAGEDCPFAEKLVGDGGEFVVHTFIISVIM